MILDALAPYRDKLANHSLYGSITSLDDLKVFMSFHVYSVWDFMNLLKYLQAHLTCNDVPWVPSPFPNNARLINEIVLEEESDLIDQRPTSHFMYYVNALTALDHVDSIQPFLTDLTSRSYTYQQLISRPYLSLSIQTFLIFTYDCIQSSPLHVAAAFAYGRETLVPLLFEPLLKLRHLDPTVSSFIAYLERHIELDGEQHGQLAEEMVANLCQSDHDWAVVKDTAIRSLKVRLAFWDAIYEAL